ncbi:embryogenesis-associated protein EMB8 isoform X2 [Herrania umbratica]|uniref:Embryogenesis-associated protein EMB8 isoform X2 n=1 Tax=Herrania umbratica TaxID=108875 RepID=A0A6J1BKM2_9ROSI|nr:embryogenesis-associated protein EMB8 isoform X2 [Herrania umbratica]
MDWLISLDESSLNAYKQLFNALFLIPISHYLLAFSVIWAAYLYNFLEIHFFQDLFSGFRGAPVSLTSHPSSPIYNDVVSKCRILHGRYLATPWLSSPHFQTAFLNFFGNPPVFSYNRQLFHASDGGTIALDWLTSSDVPRSTFEMNNAISTNDAISKDDTTPVVVVIPGLTSDSASAYIKHLAFGMAKHGWNVVVSNHRGLGGVSITSDCFYNAGWTEDVRVVIDYLHHQFPKAPLYAIGTSIGANILVKYLGEDREKVPLAGAVAICSPWDLLIGDRFICRRLVQKLYDRALTIGLQGYAKLHEPRYSRLANWEGIKKSRSIRDFDNFATCLVGKFETVDTYYRRCSSSSYVQNVSVPLLCISALDDPVCTREAIPWDECRWVRATNEFLSLLHSSPHLHVRKTQNSDLQLSLGSSIDQGPYVNVAENGMVAAVGNEHAGNNIVEDLAGLRKIHNQERDKMISASEQSKHLTETMSVVVPRADKMVSASEQNEHLTEAMPDFVPSAAQVSGQSSNLQGVNSFDVIAHVKRCLNHLSRQNRNSMWLLAYIAIITSWPLVGSAFHIFSRKKLRNVSPAALHRR